MLLKFFFIFIKDPEPDLDIYVESGAGSGQKSSGSATLTVSQQGFEVFFYVEARGFEDYSRRFFILKKSYRLHGVLDTAESKYLCSGIESIDTPDSKIRSFDTNISAKSKLHSKMPYNVNQEFRWGSLCKNWVKNLNGFCPHISY